MTDAFRLMMNFRPIIRKWEGEAYYGYSAHMNPLPFIRQEPDLSWRVGRDTSETDLDAFRHAYISYKLVKTVGLLAARVMMNSNEYFRGGALR